ncbi:MAG: hypothetical protein ACTHMT_10715 [Verrucomicrobiota bacterium]
MAEVLTTWVDNDSGKVLAATQKQQGTFAYFPLQYQFESADQR